MRRKQAEPDPLKAAEMGVAGYIPKAGRNEIGAGCVREDCDEIATHEVIEERDGRTTAERLCGRHQKDAQVEYLGTVSVRRLRLR